MAPASRLAAAPVWNHQFLPRSSRTINAYEISGTGPFPHWCVRPYEAHDLAKWLSEGTVLLRILNCYIFGSMFSFSTKLNCNALTSDLCNYLARIYLQQKLKGWFWSKLSSYAIK